MLPTETFQVNGGRVARRESEGRIETTFDVMDHPVDLDMAEKHRRLDQLCSQE